MSTRSRKARFRYVRSARAEDVSDLSAAYAAYLVEFGDIPEDDRHLRAIISTLIEAEWAQILLYERETVAGFLTGCMSYSPRSACRAMFLNDMFVYPEFRKAGIASTLLEAMADWAAAQQIKKFFMQSTPDLIGFYTSLGFREDEHLRPMSKHLGSRV
jgi:N-acetylglutamate synthase-like GNAT family acetyltransferase